MRNLLVILLALAKKFNISGTWNNCFDDNGIRTRSNIIRNIIRFMGLKNNQKLLNLLFALEVLVLVLPQKNFKIMMIQNIRLNTCQKNVRLDKMKLSIFFLTILLRFDLHHQLLFFVIVFVLQYLYITTLSSFILTHNSKRHLLGGIIIKGLDSNGVLCFNRVILPIPPTLLVSRYNPMLLTNRSLEFLGRQERFSNALSWTLRNMQLFPLFPFVRFSSRLLLLLCLVNITKFRNRLILLIFITIRNTQ